VTSGWGPSGRALALVAAGAAALVASRGFGTPALAVLGAGLIALPVLVTVLVALAAAGLELHRTIAPPRTRAGGTAIVRVARRGFTARLGLDRLLEVRVDPGLAGVAGADGVPEPKGDAWTLRPVRGDHRLPPPVASIGDPFGLARRTRRGGGTDALLVLPAAPALEGVTLGARSAGHAGSRRSRDSGFGELDRVRDYQPGDPLSRIHWAQTAKRGRLQTKELRAPAGSGRTVVVLLDGAVPPGPDYETAVTAAAALCRHLAERGDPVALAATGRVPVRLSPRAGWPAIELALARVGAGADRALGLAMRAELAASDPPDLMIVVTAAREPAILSAVGQGRTAGAGVAAVLAGPAAASSAELQAAGADVAVVPGPDRVAAALSRTRMAVAGDR
jgi:uncharacterized protein (DUF58 family)